MFKLKETQKNIIRENSLFFAFIRIFFALFSQKFAFIRDESENKIINANKSEKNANFREFLKNAIKQQKMGEKGPFFGISKNERIRIFSQFFCEFARFRAKSREFVM